MSTGTTRVGFLSVLLNNLGPEVRQAIFSLLPAERADALRAELAEQPGMDPDEEHRLLEEFDRFLTFALAEGQSHLKIHNPDDPDPDSAANSPLDAYHPSDDPWPFLENCDSGKLMGVLTREPPRVISLILAKLSPRRASQLITLFPEETRPPIVCELAREAPVSPLLLDRMARRLAVETAACAAPPEPNIAQADRVAQLLREVEKTQRTAMLKALQVDAPDVASAVLEKLYVFEDLLTATDQIIQKLLIQIDTTTLATALAGAESALTERILANLSRRARESLQEQLEMQSSVTPSLIRDARRKVVQLFAEIDQNSS